MKYCFMDKNAQSYVFLSHYRQKQTHVYTHTQPHKISGQASAWLCFSQCRQQESAAKPLSLQFIIIRENCLPSLSLCFQFLHYSSLSLSHANHPSPPPRSHRSVLTFSCDKAILYSAIFVQPDKISRTEIHQHEMVFILIHFWGRNKGIRGRKGLRYSKRKTEKKRTRD